MNEEIRWKVMDPLGNEIILKESTYQEHIGKAHQYEDAEYRKKGEMRAKETLKNPQLIITNKDEKDRHMYYKIVSMPYDDTRQRLKNIKVVVDTDRTPNEVVTWIVQSKLKDTIVEEWIVYAN